MLIVTMVPVANNTLLRKYGEKNWRKIKRFDGQARRNDNENDDDEEVERT